VDSFVGGSGGGGCVIWYFFLRFFLGGSVIVPTRDVNELEGSCGELELEGMGLSKIELALDDIGLSSPEAPPRNCSELIPWIGEKTLDVANSCCC